MQRRRICLLVFIALNIFVLTILQRQFAFDRLYFDLTITENVQMPIFKSKPLVIWSNDLHIGPLQDVKTYLAPMGVRFIDKNLDLWRSQQRNICKTMETLKVITPQNAENLNYSLIPKFYDAYRNDTEMQTVDAFACFHVAALCELYEPFNKSIVIISTNRYELGRFGKERWTKWNENLIRYASMPRNIIGANNRYDVEYIKYFTGIQPQLIPSFCNYTNASYNPRTTKFLLAKTQNPSFMKTFLNNLTEIRNQTNSTFQVTPIVWKYKNYKYSDIAAHRGIVHVPYQVSVMSFFEQYRMNIPLFVPSEELLIQWEFRYRALKFRTYNWYSRSKKDWSAIDPHPSQRSVPDPNTRNETSTRYWMKFSDYYHFPHVIYYNSVSDLAHILETITSKELMVISERMKLFNIQEDKRLRAQWKKILLLIADHSTNNPH